MRQPNMRMVCRVACVTLLLASRTTAAANATRHRRRRILLERVALPEGRSLSSSLCRENDFSCRKSTLSLESLSARVDELERRLARLSPSGWARAAKADAEPRRRPAQLLAARDTSSNIQGNETICIAVPCAPKHWPLVPRVLRSVRLQSLQPQKVLVALSHTEPSDCEARQQELSRLHAGAELKCVGGSGWTRGHNRNVAAAACGNVTIIAYIDADDQMHPRRRR